MKVEDLKEKLAKNSWETPEPIAIRFLPSSEIEAEGTVLVGRVVHYNPTGGAMNFERTKPVGSLILDLEDAPGWAKLSLEKGRLADAVEVALAIASYRFQLQPGDRRLILAIRYLGTDKAKGWKDYKVTPICDSQS